MDQQQQPQPQSPQEQTEPEQPEQQQQQQKPPIKKLNTAMYRLRQDYMNLKKNPVPYIDAEPLPSNFLEWHYVIQGPENTPYLGGYYHGTLLFTQQYPFKPPSIYMRTPNGRFTVNRRLCLSISDYHPDEWNPAWCVSTILTGLLSFMLEESRTLGSIECSRYERIVYARKSLQYNLNDVDFQALFPDVCDEIKKVLNYSKSTNNDCGGGGGDNNNNNNDQNSTTSTTADENNIEQNNNNNNNTADNNGKSSLTPANGKSSIVMSPAFDMVEGNTSNGVKNINKAVKSTGLSVSKTKDNTTNNHINNNITTINSNNNNNNNYVNLIFIISFCIFALIVNHIYQNLSIE